jgi:methyl coenzyme M reductase subunit D
VSEIEREDVIAIMTSMMELHVKVDRILVYLEGDDEEEAGEA